MEGWSPYTTVYKPLSAGSIDGTDTEPHDHGIVRAMNANYTPSEVDSSPENTLFVGRLPHTITEKVLREKFNRFGKLESVSIVRDIVTGQSKGYGFVEYFRKSDAMEALKLSQNLEIEGFRLIVDKEVGHTLKGWIPRRLGGGWGGRKEAGQLRFGCVERPFRKPIVLPKQLVGSSVDSNNSVKFSDKDRARDKYELSESSKGQHLYKKYGRWENDRHSKYEHCSERYDRSDYHHNRQENFGHHSRRDDSDKGKFYQYSKRDDRDRDHRARGDRERDRKRHDRRSHEYGERGSRGRNDNEYEGNESHSSRQDRKNRENMKRDCDL